MNNKGLKLWYTVLLIQANRACDCDGIECYSRRLLELEL